MTPIKQGFSSEARSEVAAVSVPVLIEVVLVVASIIAMSAVVHSWDYDQSSNGTSLQYSDLRAR